MSDKVQYFFEGKLSEPAEVQVFTLGAAHNIADNDEVTLTGARLKELLVRASNDEREACAAFVEDGARGAAGRDTRYQIAEAIRARCVEND